MAQPHSHQCPPHRQHDDDDDEDYPELLVTAATSPSTILTPRMMSKTLLSQATIDPDVDPDMPALVDPLSRDPQQSATRPRRRRQRAPRIGRVPKRCTKRPTTTGHKPPDEENKTGDTAGVDASPGHHHQDEEDPSDLPDLEPTGYSSSDDSDDDSDTPVGRPSFNNAAKSHTGIDFPPRKWGVKNVGKRDIQRLKRFFPGASFETIQRTLGATTQYATKGAVEGTALKERMKAPNPVLNIPRRNEDVATDTLFSSTPAIDTGGCVAAQFFIGCKSKYRSIVPLKDTDADFPSALMEEIHKRGAMNRLISDSAKAEISARVKEILNMLVIKDWQSEAHHQHQNPAERGWQPTKSWSNITLNMSGAPPECWLLVLAYICTLQNHLALQEPWLEDPN